MIVRISAFIKRVPTALKGIPTALKGIPAALKGFWVGHRAIAIAGVVILAVVIGFSGVLLAVTVGGIGSATASPTPLVTLAPTPSPSPSPSPWPTVDPTPTFDSAYSSLPPDWDYSDLDGVATTSTLAHRLPLAVMVADNEVSRPQSGISTASIVIQAYADGGEDRYMMIWQEGTASEIGPARSARPYYVYWAAEYKALYGHIGGDGHSILGVIPAMAANIYNMDELNGGSCAYHRITTRPAPQNDYTSSAALIDCAAKKKYPATYQKLPTRPFTSDTDQALRPASQVITIPFRTGTVGYQYDPLTDDYLRIVDGSPEIDPANNSHVYARNIVVMYQAYGTDAASMDHANRPWVYNVGSGAATVYLEGKAISGTWKKTSTTALTRFYDSSGAEIPLVRGEIFLESVMPDTKVVVG